VYSINAMGGTGTKLKEITINRYTNLIKLPVIKNQEYYWILNDYLYISNPMLQAIRLAACFEQEVPNEVMYPESGCGGCGPTNEDWCMNPLDKPFSLPGYLEKQVLDLVSQKLLSTYFQLKTDITDDGLDGQAPNVPPTR
jgi:hypothetical protein